MNMTQNWVLLELIEEKKTDLALPEGYEKSVADEDTFFKVLGVGPECTIAELDALVAVNPIKGMIRMKLPNYAKPVFAVQDTEIIGVLERK